MTLLLISLQLYIAFRLSSKSQATPYFMTALRVLVLPQQGATESPG